MSRLILASGSATRARLLRDAGVVFEVIPADIDEGAVKRAAQAEGRSAADCALLLAEAKARHVSALKADSLVIGADQILVAGEEWFDKPPDLAAAEAQLQQLRGQTHALVTAVCVLRAGRNLWHSVQSPKLTMRRFSDRFLEDYCVAEGERMLASVGAYRIEGRGAQLFDAIEGDYFSILGLPLIELLTFLREADLLPI